MNLETAIRLNSAAVCLAFYFEGYAGLNPEHLEIVRSCTLAQLQTAAEVVEACNAATKPGLDGITRTRLVPKAEPLAGIKRKADLWEWPEAKA